MTERWTAPEDLSMKSMTLESMPWIDADAHFTEPPDAWSARVSASQRAQVPTQRLLASGETKWFLNDEPFSGIGGNIIRKGGEKVRGIQMLPTWDEVDPASYSVQHRLELMDEQGVLAQVIYPNGIGFASNHIFSIEDLDQRALVLRVYNDYMVDLQRESGGRLLPQAMLPVWDMDFTAREMTRLLDAGITGFTLSDRPEMLGLPELHDEYYSPMWDTFNESGAVVNFHIAAGQTKEEMEHMRDNEGELIASKLPADKARLDRSEKPSGPAISGLAPPAWGWHGKQRSIPVVGPFMFLSNCRIICNLVLSDLFDRYPRLNVVSAESGIGWVPFVLETMEYYFDEFITDPAERSRTLRRPTEYFRDHISVTFWFEQFGPARAIEFIGAGNVMCESDFPHPAGLYPDPRAQLIKRLQDLDVATIRRVMYENAAELYRVSVPAR